MAALRGLEKAVAWVKVGILEGVLRMCALSGPFQMATQAGLGLTWLASGPFEEVERIPGRVLGLTKPPGGG